MSLKGTVNNNDITQVSTIIRTIINTNDSGLYPKNQRWSCYEQTPNRNRKADTCTKTGKKAESSEGDNKI